MGFVTREKERSRKMKIHIPAFKAMARCNEHMNHGPIDLDLGPDIVPIVRCKDCIWRGREECAMFYRCDCGEQHTWETDDDFCSYGERKEPDNEVSES